MTSFDVLCFLSLFKTKGETLLSGRHEEKAGSLIVRILLSPAGNLKSAMDFGHCNDNLQVFIAAPVEYLKLLPTRNRIMGEFQSCLGPLRSSRQNSNFCKAVLESGWVVWRSQCTRPWDKSPGCVWSTSVLANALRCLTNKTRLDNKVTNAAKIIFCV